MAVHRAIEALRELQDREPQISDDLGLWLAPRVSLALRRMGVRTFAELTLRVPRRHRWWSEMVGIGPASTHRIEAFFLRYPALTESARRLEGSKRTQRVIWSDVMVARSRDGSRG
jgi:hypothetical protein